MLGSFELAEQEAMIGEIVMGQGEEVVDMRGLSRASRFCPASTFTPNSRLYSPAMVLFSAFMMRLGKVPSFTNVSAQ